MGSLLAAWKFLSSPLGRFIGISALCLTVGFVGGYRAHKKLSDLGWYKAKVAALELNIKTRDAAAKADQEKAVANAIEQTRLSAQVSTATVAASDRECLSPAISDSVRQFWGVDGKNGRPPARSR
jgi:hypothetical protein